MKAPLLSLFSAGEIQQTPSALVADPGKTRQHPYITIILKYQGLFAKRGSRAGGLNARKLIVVPGRMG
jgi:hypothetical protein